MEENSYSAIEIANILSGDHQLGAPELRVSNLLIDSRKGRRFVSSLFVAIVGDFRDGHRFISEMYDKGVRNFLVSKVENSFPDANYFVVSNTIDALQNLARSHRESTPIPVIGVTGSNGKTIVKEWLYQLLRADFDIIRNPKSYNSQIGVALSVWPMGMEYNLGIFEAGISKPGEMKKLKKIIQPTVGIFTNIGQAHQENFKSFSEKIEEKLKLFTDVDLLIYPKDSEEINAAVSLKIPKQKQLSWGRSNDADLRIISQRITSKRTVIHAEFKHKKLELKVPFWDDASVENIVHCWLYMLHLEMPQSTISDRFSQIEPIAMRLEQKSGIDGSTIINDAYNADITALDIALDYLDRINHPRKTVILSDFLQSGESSEKLYHQINTKLQNHQVNRFIGIGTELFENQDQFNLANQHFYQTTSQFIDQIQAFSFHQEGILIKGARKFKFEQIASKLALKTHQTQLEINLDALKHNLRYYQKQLKPAVKVMVMVKAYGYGAGGPEVARLLALEDVNYLGVAYADEGVAIRKAGITTPIMVMNPSEESYAAMINYNLEPEIYSLDVLDAFSEALSSEGMLNASYKVHIKLDTGMNRLGFRPEELPKVLAALKREKYLKVASVFSHLASSDDPADDEFTREQIAQFTSLSERIKQELGYDFIQHISNTAAIERFPDAQFDMVRLGVGLYGVARVNSNKKQLQTVSSLYSIVVQIKIVKAGESVGYGRRFIAKQEMTIAIIPIGYADGLRRSLGNQKGSVYVSGAKRPIIGNVCMDLIMVDITGLPTKVNDRVEIFGNHISVDEIAKLSGTISYEILSSIPPRVKRVYIKEDS